MHPLGLGTFDDVFRLLFRQARLPAFPGSTGQNIFFVTMTNAILWFFSSSHQPHQKRCRSWPCRNWGGLWWNQHVSLSLIVFHVSNQKISFELIVMVHWQTCFPVSVPQRDWRTRLNIPNSLLRFLLVECGLMTTWKSWLDSTSSGFSKKLKRWDMNEA